METETLADDLMSFLLSGLEPTAYSDRRIDKSTHLRRDVLAAEAIHDLKAPAQIGHIIMSPILIPSPKFTLPLAGTIMSRRGIVSTKQVLVLGYNPNAEVILNSKRVLSSVLYRITGAAILKSQRINVLSQRDELLDALVCLGSFIKSQTDNEYMTREEYYRFMQIHQ